MPRVDTTALGKHCGSASPANAFTRFSIVRSFARAHAHARLRTATATAAPQTAVPWSAFKFFLTGGPIYSGQKPIKFAQCGQPF